jgi:hypothetical protein
MLRAALVLGLLAPGCARCTDEPDEVEPAAVSAARPHVVHDEEVPTPTVEQLPLPQDFAEHAGQTVTEANYVGELDRIAAELGEATPDTTGTTPATTVPAAARPSPNAGAR